MATQEWHQFFDACLRKRLPPKKFRTLFQTFNLKHVALHGRTLVHVLLDQGRKASSRQVDPRIPLYVRELLHMEAISINHVLSTILLLPVDNSTNINDAQSDPMAMDAVGFQSPRMETTIFQMMTVEISNGLVKSKEELPDILRTLAKTKCNRANSDALGYFISAILNTTFVHDILNHASSKSVEKRPSHL